jgi:signal transduction histidine kinase/CheY-like chemotaxis protein
VQHLAVEIPYPTHVGHFAVTVESVGAAGALAIGTEVTSEVVARELGGAHEMLIWCGTATGAAGYYNARWHAVIGREWREALHPSDARRWIGAIGHAQGQTEPSELDVRLRTREGSYRWYRLRFASRFHRVVCGASDVDLERTFEAECRELANRAREARAEADRAHRLKDEFLAAVSHELRAPLTTLLLWEKVLREHCEDEATRDQALDAIHQSAVAQERMVTDLLDYARGISGKLYLDIRMVDVEAVVADAVEAARPLAFAKQLDLVLSTEPFSSGVHADATRLRQIFDNLLANAIKFTPARGTVTVAVAPRGRWIEVAVADNGRGIESEMLTRIFEPFTQVEDSITRREGGLGLGLTISRQLADLHRGTLVAQSEGLGKGARFALTLPAAGSPRALSPPLGVRRASTLEGARVLVIDDDARVRHALSVLLGRIGAVVATADCAATGRARIASEDPEIVICDIAMPGEDGYSLVRQLRATGCAVPSIALTAYATKADAERALEAGFDVHLAKPISLERLVDAVSELLSGRRVPVA